MAEDLSLFQEIDDSMRVERLQQFWSRYGNLVIGAFVLVILATIVTVVWKDHLHTVRAAQTSVLMRAQELMAQGKYDDAIHMLEGSKAHGNLGELTGLALGNAYLKAGNKDKAVVAYNDVAQGNGDKALKDYASLQVGLITGKPPQLGEASPFTDEANEIKAVQLLKAGKTQEARGLLKPITIDDHAPQSERTRAQDLLDSIPEGSK